MAKTMTKYQLDHFKQKVRRQFDPLIDEHELLVKQYRTEATNKVVGKLAKKMGADKILDQFRKAETLLKKAREDAKTFFEKKAKTQEGKKELNYNFTDRDERISLEDCEEQLRDWAKTLVDREIERRPEGHKLKQLRDLKTKAIDTVMEAGTPEVLIISLNQVSKKIGMQWNTDIKALPNVQ
tara:strand:+ start:19 stop:564 length:546 start_codon:yes stop_codon:yes gene_type:complete